MMNAYIYIYTHAVYRLITYCVHTLTNNERMSIFSEEMKNALKRDTVLLVYLYTLQNFPILIHNKQMWRSGILSSPSVLFSQHCSVMCAEWNEKSTWLYIPLKDILMMERNVWWYFWYMNITSHTRFLIMYEVLACPQFGVCMRKENQW